MPVLPAFDDPRVVGDEDRRSERLALLRRSKSTATAHLDAFTSWLRAARSISGLIIASADVDGMASAVQMAQASGWKIAALIPSGTFTDAGNTLFAPGLTADDVADAAAHHRLLAVDAYSPRVPSISNHPVFMGSPLPFNVNDQAEARVIGRAIIEHDSHVRAALQPRASGATSFFCLNPNVWARIIGTARRPDDLKFKTQRRSGAWSDVFKEWSDLAVALDDPVADPDDLPLARLQAWKYPLGSAQVVAAAIDYAEARMREQLDSPIDRDFLPFIIANSDDGLGAYFHYADHARDWWGLLDSVGGPRIASLMNAVEVHGLEGMLSARRRFGHDFPEFADLFDDDWNFSTRGNAATRLELLRRVGAALQTLTGYDDPFLDGADRLPTWTDQRGGLGNPTLQNDKIRNLNQAGPDALETRLQRLRNADLMAISIRDEIYFGSRSRF